MKKYIILFLAAIMVFAMAACGSPTGETADSGSEETGQEQTEETEGEEAETAADPYAWLGLQDMPECSYLDTLATNHYYKKSDMYVSGLSYVGHEINAVDGINTYKEDEYSRVYSVGGKILSINESSKIYMEEDMSDMAESRAEQLEDSMKNGKNIYERSFAGTGSESVPIYSELTDDKDEYEYYEYSYPLMENSEDSYTERYYMKDGDVFAIYNKTVWGDTVVESTEIIKEMSGNIPEGTFELPDLSGYEKADI